MAPVQSPVKSPAKSPAKSTVQKPANVEPPSSADHRGNRRELVGVVTSDKMQKTVVVIVTRRVKAPKFEKFVTRRVKYKAHSENNDVHIGDTVMITESRPMSKDKRWRVSKLITRARSA